MRCMRSMVGDIHEVYESAFLKQIVGPYVRIGPQEVATADIEAYRVIHRVGSDYDKGPWQVFDL